MPTNMPPKTLIHEQLLDKVPERPDFHQITGKLIFFRIHGTKSFVLT